MVAFAVPENKPPVPANSISKGVYQDWEEGREYFTFVELTRKRFGERSDEFFVATQVMESRQNAALHRGGGGGYPGKVWAVPVGELGEGAFGTVTKLDVPTLGKSYAAKLFKKVVSCCIGFWLRRVGRSSHLVFGD